MLYILYPDDNPDRLREICMNDMGHKNRLSTVSVCSADSTGHTHLRAPLTPTDKNQIRYPGGS